MIDCLVASENTQHKASLKKNRWLNGIYDEINNCSNLNQSMEPTTSIDSDNKEQENVESKLPGLGLKKTSLTMAHMFELCLKKEEHGTCRNCRPMLIHLHSMNCNSSSLIVPKIIQIAQQNPHRKSLSMVYFIY